MFAIYLDMTAKNCEICTELRGITQTELRIVKKYRLSEYVCQNILKNFEMKIIFYTSFEICRSSETRRRTQQTESTVMCLINQAGLWMYFLILLILLC